MKKLSYLAIATAALSMAACSGQKAGYTITGTVEGAAEGDTVYLEQRMGRKLVPVDTAVIKNNKFVFEGVQDSAVLRNVSYLKREMPMTEDFFLENGQINVTLAATGNTATGTPNNNAYQELKTKLGELNNRMSGLYQALADTTLTQEKRAEIMKEGRQIEEEYGKVIKEATEKNITNAVGVFLFKQAFNSNTTEENEALLKQMPANYQQDPNIVHIKKYIERQKATAVGAKFVDFEMQTPDGKPVKLSDYVGKGKVVLVDFWASWCGPCRHEMPNLVKAYAQFKNKNFEIVGVSLDSNVESWKDAIKKLNITWPQMSDLKFWQCEGAQLYAVNGIPHTVLIDGEGTIVARGLHGQEMIDKIAELVK